MAHVLVIEDDTGIREVLDYSLRQAGHEVELTASGADGLRLARAHAPDVVLLDLMLPDVSGTDVCRALKADPGTQSIPVMIVSARGEEIDRVVGFELGADDYVTKPFSVRELLLRMVAVLRRTTPHEQPPSLIQFGSLRIDRDAHRVWVNDEEVDLTAIEFKLLITLHERKNRVQTRASLLATAWGMSDDNGTRTVDTHVKRLREKLGPAAQYIETVRGVGYRFRETPP
jgi:two-component system phosphate regulon response regulator PhoB